MKTKEISPKHFLTMFRTEKQCIDYLFSIKYPDGFVCWRCHHKHYTELSTRSLWVCQSCGFQDSAKAGTLFHKSKVSLANWFLAIYEFTISKGGIAATELRERLGLGSYKTAWLMLHKLRVAMKRRDDNYKLNDDKKEDWIELDGAVFGRRKTGTASEAYVAVEGQVFTDAKTGDKKIRTGFVKTKKVEGFKKSELIKFTDDNLEELAYARADMAKEIELAKNDVAVAIKTKVMGSDKEKLDSWLPLVHRFISNIKSSLRGVYHGVSRRHVDKYLAEYAWRTSRRRWRRQLQLRLLGTCVAAGPVCLRAVMV